MKVLYKSYPVVNHEYVDIGTETMEKVLHLHPKLFTKLLSYTTVFSW